MCANIYPLVQQQKKIYKRCFRETEMESKETFSININLVTVAEMNGLLMLHEGYIDGDKRTIELSDVKRWR